MRFIVKILIVVLLHFGLFNLVSAKDETQEKIIDRIEKSKTSLAKLEAQIGKESRALAKALSKKQREVLSLRQKASDFQRLEDEQLLSLEAIKNRVEKWETQSAYQKHLLRAFNDAIGDPTPETVEQITRGELLTNSIQRLKARISPDWKDTSVISKSGEIFSASVLKIGPVEIFFRPEKQQANAIMRDFQGQASVLQIFSQKQSNWTQELFENHRGYFVFDPSLGSAQKLSGQNSNIIEHVSKGGVWALPILLFGFLSLLVALIKGVHLFSLPKVDLFLFEKIQSFLMEHGGNNIAEQNNMKKSLLSLAPKGSHAQSQLLKIALTNPVSDHRDELLLAFLQEYRHRLEKLLGVVATSAAVAPLLGLLGTVSGMISTFKLMTIFGSGDASIVSGGISEALVTTELGLIVAIPSLLVSALLARKSKSYNQKLETFAIKLSKLDLH